MPNKNLKILPATRSDHVVRENVFMDRRRREETGIFLGSHLSIAGEMTNAIKEAVVLGLSTVQIFTKNQQQWKAKPLAEETIKRWKKSQEEAGFASLTVSHASYLINLASPDDDLWKKSIDLMQNEIERCEVLEIPYLVHHPGAYTSSSLDEGLSKIAQAYQELFRRTKGYQTVSCLENTAGAGSTIGRTFEELADLRSRIIEKTGQSDRVGFCIDTCHAHAGGYDLSTPEKAGAAIQELQAKLGMENIRVVHLNDSKAPCGSKLDRHEHIGLGTIGDAGFAAILNDSGFKHKPMILETPKGPSPDGRPWDTVNLQRLEALIQAAN